jgi:hypothetical protein
MMKHYYRDPQVEEGVSNIILQNRCGNRLSIIMHEGRTELEFVYKPNAFRRKEFRARNFSNRDNFTALFASCEMREIGVEFVQKFDYDPFVTRLTTLAPGKQCRNTLTFLNLPKENAFAIAARQPLLLTFRPHKAFVIADGLLTERFADRGEEIVSFIKFDGFEENRFRVTDDGRCVLQLVENDLLFVGGEENPAQVTRALKTYAGLDLPGLEARIEQDLEPVLGTAVVKTPLPDVQRVLDVNKRVIYSGLDEGGACFGALNRIYHLIWPRDGSMTAAQMAGAGLPAFLRIWTPFLLANPSKRQRVDGKWVNEYLQIVGSRWTKSEDDGLYYAMTALYTLYQTTGDLACLHPATLTPMLDALDYMIQSRWNQDLGLLVSDTRGETSLAGSPYFGYDIVTGDMIGEPTAHFQHDGRDIWKSSSYYLNSNGYNCVRMAEVLLAAAGVEPERAARYREFADQLQASIRRSFLMKDGRLGAGLLLFEDGSNVLTPFGKNDPWEYTWSLSLGPFFPDGAAALKSARHVREAWPKLRPYGFSPWNTLSRRLKEFGLSDGDYGAMLKDEVAEALMVTKKYPMPGALTEYLGQVESWRALPFSAGTFIASVTSLLMQSLPQGLAVRASGIVDEVRNFQYRIYRLDARAAGKGERVAKWTLNGKPMPATLQIPEESPRPGRNVIEVTRGKPPAGARLYGSDARLLRVEQSGKAVRYHFASAVPAELYFENLGKRTGFELRDRSGKCVDFKKADVPGTTLTRISAACGEFAVGVR